MSNAMSFIQNKISSYKQYGASTVGQIIGSDLHSADSISANTLAHTLFLNRSSRFEAIPLPPEAQFSPAFYAGVADYDGDGHDDLFISQNFFMSQPETPRIDAGRGLWLRGDGTGRLIPVDGQISGVKIYGEQRGAALSDFDNDGKVDLIVSQNAAMTRLFRNKSGKTGLRVRLAGPPQNPTGVGAVIQLIFKNYSGPVREIHSGSGYWSQDSPIMVFGIPETPQGIKIRWPGGKITETDLPENIREITINHNGEICSMIKSE